MEPPNLGHWAKYPGLGTQAKAGDEQCWSTGYWPLGWVFGLKLATSNPGIQAIGRWAKYPGLGPRFELMCAFDIARCLG